MKFTVNSVEFARSLTPAYEVVVKNSKKEEDKPSNLITLEATSDKILVKAATNTVSVICEISDSVYGDLGYSCKDEGIVTTSVKNMMESLRSLPPSEVEVSEKKGEVFIVSKKNRKFKRSFATYDEKVKVMGMGKKVEQELTVDREIFLKGINRVFFALCDEESLYQYMCLVFEAEKNMARFSCGNGARFVIDEIEGKNILKTKGGIRMTVPKTVLPTIKKILSEVSDESISIKQIEKDDANHIPEQIVFSFSDMTLRMYGIEPFSTFPSISHIMTRDYSNHVYCSSTGWNYAANGIAMTKNDHMDKIHNSEVTIEPDDCQLIIKSCTKNDAVSPVTFDDTKTTIKGEAPWFRCNSAFLQELATCTSEDAELEVCFEDQSVIEGDDDPNAANKVGPVRVKFPDVSDEARDTIEKFIMFFAVSNQ